MPILDQGRKTMIIEVPFMYVAQVVPPRKRKPVEMCVIDQIAIKFKDIPEQNFPVAIKYVDDDSLPHDEEQRRERLSNPDLIRWDGNNLYTRIGAEFNTRDEFNALLRGNPNDSPLNNVQGWSQHRDWKHGEPVLLNNLQGQVQSDNRRDRIAALIEYTNSCRVCKNGLWEITQEPAWMVSQSFNFTVIKATQINPDNLRTSWNNIYAGNEYDMIPERFKQEDSFTSGLIEVLLPQALKLKPAQKAIRKECEEFLYKIREDLYRFDDTTILAYMNLRRVCKDAQAMDDESAANILMDATKDFPLLDSETSQESSYAFYLTRLNEARDRYKQEQDRDEGITFEEPNQLTWW
jgi:hypothetical protein